MQYFKRFHPFALCPWNSTKYTSVRSMNWNSETKQRIVFFIFFFWEFVECTKNDQDQQNRWNESMKRFIQRPSFTLKLYAKQKKNAEIKLNFFGTRKYASYSCSKHFMLVHMAVVILVWLNNKCVAYMEGIRWHIV